MVTEALDLLKSQRRVPSAAGPPHNMYDPSYDNYNNGPYNQRSNKRNNRQRNDRHRNRGQGRKKRKSARHFTKPDRTNEDES